MGRAAGFLAEILGLARLVAELVALKRALGRDAAPPDSRRGPGGRVPADPPDPRAPPAGVGREAPPAVRPGPDPLGPGSAGGVDGWPGSPVG